MALVLAIEPDIRQAEILKHIVRELVRAELILVETRDDAIAAIDQQLPDVILLTALLSPRDEDELISHLRRLGAAEHLQTHTIPLLSGARVTEQSGRSGGLLGKFRKKKEVEQIAGCDPEMFAAEIRAFLARAAELKAEARTSARASEFAKPAGHAFDEPAPQRCGERQRERAACDDERSRGTGCRRVGGRVVVVLAFRMEVQLLLVIEARDAGGGCRGQRAGRKARDRRSSRPRPRPSA